MPECIYLSICLRIYLFKGILTSSWKYRLKMKIDFIHMRLLESLVHFVGKQLFLKPFPFLMRFMDVR